MDKSVWSEFSQKKEFEQLNIFDITLPKFRIDKPIRLIVIISVSEITAE